MLALQSSHIVSHADWQALQTSQSVELSEHEVSQAVDAHSIANNNSIEPTATARTTSDHTILMALSAQPITLLIGELGWECASANASGVSLRHTQHAVDLGWTNTSARASATCSWVRRGDKWVSAMVDVEHGGLAAFEQNILTLIQSLVQHERHIGGVRTNLLAIFQQLVKVFCQAHRLSSVDLFNQLVLQLEVCLNLSPQMLFIKQIGHSDSDAIHLVGISWADAPTRRANLRGAARTFVELIHVSVVRSGDVSTQGDQKLGAIDTLALQRVHLVDEHLRVDDNARANNRSDVLIHHATRQQMQGVALVTNDDGMASIGTAVVASHVIDAGTQQVRCFTLAFVSPLSSNNNNSCHMCWLLMPHRCTRLSRTSRVYTLHAWVQGIVNGRSHALVFEKIQRQG